MSKFASLATATALASVLLMGPALAQTAAPAVKDAAKTETKISADAAKAAADKKRAISLECSKEADAKSLRGKERKKFRSECKRQKSETSADKPK